MSSLRPGSVWWSSAAPPALVLALLALAAAARPTRAQAFGADAGWRDVSVAEYRQHLEIWTAWQPIAKRSADSMARRQRRRRRRTKPRAIRRALVPTTACTAWRPETRSLVRSATIGCALCWAARKTRALRRNQPLSDRFADAKSHPLSVDALLAEARQRLQEDAKQAESTAEANPSYAGERKSLNAILAQKAYQGVTEVSVTGSLSRVVL